MQTMQNLVSLIPVSEELFLAYRAVMLCFPGSPLQYITQRPGLGPVNAATMGVKEYYPNGEKGINMNEDYLVDKISQPENRKQ